jgi:hypothetical protein
MEFAIGVLLALAAGVFTSALKMDRDRSLYPVIMIVIALIYSLWAVVGGSNEVLLLEAVIGLLFIAAAVIGYRSGLWIVAAALVAHGIYDIFHPQLFDNPGVPKFWPVFCMAYDVTAGAFLALLIYRRRVPAAALSN